LKLAEEGAVDEELFVNPEVRSQTTSKKQQTANTRHQTPDTRHKTQDTRRHKST
jgi:hypothetical protein